MNEDISITVELVERARHEEQIYDLIYSELAPRLELFIYKSVGDTELSKDLASETFLRGYEVLRGYSGKGFSEKDKSPRDKSLFPYFLYKIAKNLIRDHFRRPKRIILGEMDTAMNVSSNDSPDDAILQEELRVIIQTKLSKLPDRYREVINLHYYRELSLKEVSDELDRRHGTVIEQNQRAIQKLKKNYNRLREQLPS